MKSPAKLTLEELLPYVREYARRNRTGKPGKPRVLRPCPKCYVEFGARELREHIPRCPAKIDK